MSRRDDDDDDSPEERRRRRRQEDDEDDDYPDVRRRRSRDMEDDPGLRMLLPIGRSGWAIAAGYLGLISVLCIPAPFALLAGILAIREMNRNPKKHGMGRAVFGIIMGSLGMIGLVLLLLILAFGQTR